MRSFSKLGLTLIVVFFLSLLCLAVTLLHFLCRHRRKQQQTLAGDAELGCKGASFNAHAVLNFILCTNQSRVEPSGDSPVSCASGRQLVKISTAAAVEGVDEECAQSMWRAVAFGPSRVLYTIKEEEREGLEFEDKEEEDLFTTPCESPAFYTPVSSPSRAPEKEGAVVGRVSLPAEKGFGIS